MPILPEDETDSFMEPLAGVASTLPVMEQHDAALPKGMKAAAEHSLAADSGSVAPTIKEHTVVDGGYGGDPNLVTPRSPWPRVLTLYNRNCLAALSDLILPAEDGEASPSEVAIDEFFDDWLSAPYARHVADKAQILAGLRALDERARDAYGADVLHLIQSQLSQVLDELVASGDEGRSFFLRLRYLVIGGYFTSDAGMRALGYRGNVPLKAPPQVSEEALRIIEQEMKKLGL